MRRGECWQIVRLEVNCWDRKSWIVWSGGLIAGERRETCDGGKPAWSIELVH